MGRNDDVPTTRLWRLERRRRRHLQEVAALVGKDPGDVRRPYKRDKPWPGRAVVATRGDEVVRKSSAGEAAAWLGVKRVRVYKAIRQGVALHDWLIQYEDQIERECAA